MLLFLSYYCCRITYSRMFLPLHHIIIYSKMATCSACRDSRDPRNSIPVPEQNGFDRRWRWDSHSLHLPFMHNIIFLPWVAFIHILCIPWYVCCWCVNRGFSKHITAHDIFKHYNISIYSYRLSSYFSFTR